MSGKFSKNNSDLAKYFTFMSYPGYWNLVREKEKKCSFKITFLLLSDISEPDKKKKIFK